ncbi:MAG: PASTA domain-containing protein [Bacteroidaceae bacterium]|nr:PASTA domain-containing protein [Bacteroidaceae bacterium]
MISLKDFFSFKKNRAFWLNLIAMPIVVLAIIFGVLHWLDDYTHHGQSIIVPNVKGLPFKQAEAEFNKKNLKAVVVDSNYVKGMPAGAVLEQKPSSGAKVKTGRTIYLTINTAEMPRVAIPDIIDNSSYRQAEARLRALGFKLTAPEIISGEKDWVYAVKYMEKELTNGEKIPRESVLTLIIGNDEIKADSLNTDSLIIGTPKGTNPVIDESWF